MAFGFLHLSPILNEWLGSNDDGWNTHLNFDFKGFNKFHSGYLLLPLTTDYVWMDKLHVNGLSLFLYSPALPPFCMDLKKNIYISFPVVNLSS